MTHCGDQHNQEGRSPARSRFIADGLGEAPDEPSGDQVQPH